jgi:cell division protein FtsB
MRKQVAHFLFGLAWFFLFHKLNPLNLWASLRNSQPEDSLRGSICYNKGVKMIEKIKNYILYIVRNITDLRVLGQVIFGILILLVSWSCVKAIGTNADLQKQIAKLQQENEVFELETQNLKLKNQYLETNQFLEIAARRQFGKGAPGEKALTVPKSVAIAHSIDVPAEKTKERTKTEVQQPKYEENLEAWRNFFFHSNN